MAESIYEFLVVSLGYCRTQIFKCLRVFFLRNEWIADQLLIYSNCFLSVLNLNLKMLCLSECYFIKKNLFLTPMNHYEKRL